MRETIRIIGTVIIWGLLIWGNVALVSWANTTYQERMDTNYILNTYSGRALLTQEEYTQFKQYLLNPEVAISKLDVYGSEDILVIYDITAPDSYKSPILDEPHSQRWKYEKGRGMDYGGFALVIFISLVFGLFLSLALHQVTQEEVF